MKRIKENSLTDVVHNLGGKLISLKFNFCEPVGKGCGALTYVEGTNGGQMPCGANLTRFGVTKPYYCALCAENLN